VALHLDVLELASRPGVDEVRDRVTPTAWTPPKDPRSGRQEMLLAEIGDGFRLAIPLGAVDRPPHI